MGEHKESISHSLTVLTIGMRTGADPTWAAPKKIMVNIAFQKLNQGNPKIDTQTGRKIRFSLKWSTHWKFQYVSRIFDQLLRWVEAAAQSLDIGFILGVASSNLQELWKMVMKHQNRSNVIPLSLKQCTTKNRYKWRPWTPKYPWFHGA